MSSSSVNPVHTHRRNQPAQRGVFHAGHEAWSKSAQIILRSSPVWSTALFGLSLMSLDELLDGARAAISCATLMGLAKLGRDLAPRLLAGGVRRFCLLTIIAMEIGDEAGYPLRHWLLVELEKLAPPPSA